jgi:hypothetical protein
MDHPSIDGLNLSDSDDALFDTPTTRKGKTKDAKTKLASEEAPAASKTRPAESKYTTEEAREAALRKELESVRNVNKVIEDVVESLEKAKSNMGVCAGSCSYRLLSSIYLAIIASQFHTASHKRCTMTSEIHKLLTYSPLQTVSRTVHNASTLLQTWTRILSQTEHNQRLILSPNWQGATQDLADIENEETQRQYAAARREAEDQARREAAARRAAEEERRREPAPTRTPGRGRGRGTRGARGSSSTSSSGYVGVGGQGGRGVPRAGSSTGRVASGIGRGLRGRGRGLG